MIACRDLRFTYPGESFELRIASLEVGEGATVALVGPSGCGKTTLLNLVAGILLPDGGEIEVGGELVNRLPAAGRQRFRLGHIGLVPQNFELLDYLTVEENLLVPFRLADRGIVSGEMTGRAGELAERTGIAALLEKYPAQLSQGERQRLALCRGLVASPSLILADEPTGNLDPENQDRIVSLLLEEAGRIGATVLMVTHERELEERFERVVNVLELREEAGA